MTICKFFGFDVRIDPSWVILAILIIWSLATNVFPEKLPGMADEVYWQMGAIGLFALIFSILAHEVAHAVIAQYYDMPITGIVLFIFGGVAEMEGEPSHPKGEFLMAIAGPIMSFLVGVFFWASAYFYETQIGSPESDVAVFCHYFAYVNFFIAAFNMFPAFPLDGGRALRAILWKVKGDLVLATRVASETGYIFGYGLLAYGLYRIMYMDFVGGIWSAVLGLFMHAAANYAVRRTESHSVLSGRKVSEFMKTEIVTVSPNITVAELVDEYVYNYYHENFPVIDNDELVGVITINSIMNLDRRRWPWIRVATVMNLATQDNTISPDMDASDALDMMRATGLQRLLVLDDRKKLVGVLSIKDMLSYLSIEMRLGDRLNRRFAEA